MISGNIFAGVNVYGAGPDNLVAGNLVGTNVTGSVALGNLFDPAANFGGFGVNVAYSPDTVVGEPGGGNVISGNGLGTTNSANVLLSESSGSVVQSNFIGTDITGTVALSTETLVGVYFQNGSYTIGGLTPTPGTGLGNVISGNEIGIYEVGSTGSVAIEGNIIGADATGEHALPNPIGGIRLAQDSGVTIGGTAAGAGNLISGNNAYGSAGNVYLYLGSTQNVIEGNLINTDITGLAALPAPLNEGYGVLIADGSTDNTIGGTSAAARNVISGNAGVLISDATTSGNVVLGNYIGVNESGTAAIANTGDGVEIANGATGNTIGGTAAGAGNVISGNTADGVEITGSGTTGNVVAGNFIGTNAAGAVAIANDAGVEIDSGASGNRIGSSGAGSVTDAAARNIISGNSFAGVWITGMGTNGNVVAGDYIGTDVNGTTAVGNGGHEIVIGPNEGVEGGIVISDGASNNLVGTSGQSADDAGERNVVAGNDGDGVDIYGSGTTGNVVAGNFVGTTATGASALGNGGDGVLLAQLASANPIGVNSLYGPETSHQANVIAGSSYYGIEIFNSTNSIVAGNLVGTNAAGTAAIPNQWGIGIANASSSNLIGTSGQDGADDALERNVISGNTRVGVIIGGGSVAGASSNNVVAGDYIGTNAAGTSAIANATGVEIFSADSDVATSNWVGVNSVYGPVNADQGNVVSGNTGQGVYLGNAGTTGNVVAGNLVGVNAVGTAAIANGDGVLIDGGGSGNSIGGTAAGAGNVISGNTDDGVEISGSGTTGNVVAGNLVGTDVVRHRRRRQRRGWRRSRQRRLRQPDRRQHGRGA